MINESLREYVEKNIFPRYSKFYSHGMLHINNVIKNMLMLADFYGLDENMAFVIASYHDTGLAVSRENHEKESGKVLEGDAELKKFFTPEQIEIMKQAVEDHRGSRKTRPRNIYGECVSDSDRDFDIFLLAKKIMNVLKEVYMAESVYLCTMCDGKMNHFHLQLIPRYSFEERGSKNFVKERFLYQEDKEKLLELRKRLNYKVGE